MPEVGKAALALDGEVVVVINLAIIKGKLV